MTSKLARSILAATFLAALTYGIARPATSRYEERRRAILAAANAERQRLGLTDRKALFARYPTPQIKLCRAVSVPPGAAAEVVIQGKFEPGTKFLIENDNLDVLKENLTAAEYRATVSAARTSGPSYANVHAFAPASAANARCLAVLIGGKYQWDFTAENGWRVLLRPVLQKPVSEAGKLPEQMYQAEFFRGAESRAFASFDAALDIAEAPSSDSYSAHLLSQPSEPPGMAELKRLQQQMMNMHKLSPAEQDQLIKRMEQLAASMEAQAGQQMARIQEQQRKMREVGCTELQFRLEPDAVKGHMACQNEQELARQVGIKGTVKFLGPW